MSSEINLRTPFGQMDVLIGTVLGRGQEDIDDQVRFINTALRHLGLTSRVEAVHSKPEPEPIYPALGDKILTRRGYGYVTSFDTLGKVVEFSPRPDAKRGEHVASIEEITLLRQEPKASPKAVPAPVSYEPPFGYVETTAATFAVDQEVIAVVTYGDAIQEYRGFVRGTKPVVAGGPRVIVTNKWHCTDAENVRWFRPAGRRAF